MRGGHDQPALACPDTEVHLGADLRSAGERLLPKIRRRRRLEPGRGLAPLHGRLVGGRGVTYAGVLVDGERHLLLSVGAGEDR